MPVGNRWRVCPSVVLMWTQMAARRERIGTMLLRRGFIGQEDLERALDAQGLVGGRIGTALVELGCVTVDELAHCLAEQLQVPAADFIDLYGAPRNVLDRVPAAVCARYRVFPLTVHDDKVLTLAMLDPADLSAIDELTFLLNLRIRAVVVPEVRLVRALEQRYGVPRDRRFQRIPDEAALAMARRRAKRRPEAGPAADGDQLPADAQPPADDDDPESELVYLDAVTQPPPPAGDDFEVTEGTPVEAGDDVDVDADELDFEVIVELPETAGAPTGPQLETGDLQQVIAGLEQARDRESVLNLLVCPVVPGASVRVVFLVKGGEEVAVGLRAGGTEASIEEVRGLVVPLGSSSLLRRAYTTLQPAQGAASVDSTQQIISRYLRAPEPAEAWVAPVAVRSRVVNLLCLQTSAADGFGPEVPATLRVLCDAAAAAYLRLIVDAKKGRPPVS